MVGFEDARSKRFAFVPFCAMSPAFRARGIIKSSKNAMGVIVKELIDRDVNLVQLPCPESQLCGYEVGLSRGPKGMRGYDNFEFRELCGKAADEVVDMIKGILKNGYEVCVILGIENSPSCAVSYQYARSGLIEGRGIFMEILHGKLEKEGIKIPFVGIDSGKVNVALEKVKDILDGKVVEVEEAKDESEESKVGDVDSGIEGW